MKARRSRSALICLALAAAFCATFTLGPVPTAGACSCAATSVADTVRAADAVYIARPRAVDLLPGASFRILRVLKGPVLHNARVGVAHGGGGACGTGAAQLSYVLTSERANRLSALSLCNEYMRGPAAVREARLALGPGRPVGFRPDVVWLAQWLIPIAVIAILLVLLRHRAASARRAPDDPRVQSE